MSTQRKLILEFAHKNNGQISKRQAVELLKKWYYSNANTNIGAILCGMANAGILERVERGHYKINKL